MTAVIIAIILLAIVAAVALVLAVRVFAAMRMQPAGRHVRTVPVPAQRRPVNGQYRGTQPRRTPGKQPWQTAQNPMLRDQPVVPAYAVFGEASVAAMLEAEGQRHHALAMGPNGCEQT